MPELFHYFVVGFAVLVASIMLILSLLVAMSPINDDPLIKVPQPVVYACIIGWAIVATTLLGAMVVGR